VNVVDIPRRPRNYIIERCRHCNRRLAEWFEGDDHVTLLHPKAGIQFGAVVDAPYPLDTEIPMQPQQGTATCLRWRCKLRRRLSRQ
jgi:hypothetical protein